MKLLLVAYQPHEQSHLQRAIRRGTHRVHAAEGYGEAEAMLDSAHYDAVLVAGGSGHATEAVRQFVWRVSQGAERPIVVVTLGGRDADECQRLQHLGADTCHLAPFSFNDVLDQTLALHRTLSRLPYTAGSLFSISLDPVERELREGLRWTALTKREYLIVECLLREPNAPVERTALVGYAWPDPEDVDGPRVNLAISRLRRKLVEKGFNCRIDTISRVGYQMTVW